MDSQESSPAPQLEGINCLVLCLLHGPALSTVHDHREDQALTIWTSVGREMSLLFNTLSRFVVAFLPRSNCLLISCLQSPSAVILESKKRKPITVSTFSLLFARQLEKAVAPHSSTLAWKIPWTEEPGGLPSLGSHRVGHD